MFANRAEIALVEPGIGLFGEDAGDAFAMQVCPLIGGTIHPHGQVFQAFRVHLFHRVLYDGLGVLELDRRKVAFQIAVSFALVADLGNGT